MAETQIASFHQSLQTHTPLHLCFTVVRDPTIHSIVQAELCILSPSFYLITPNPSLTSPSGLPVPPGIFSPS